MIFTKTRWINRESKDSFFSLNLTSTLASIVSTAFLGLWQLPYLQTAQSKRACERDISW